jgi:hypothetical protein
MGKRNCIDLMLNYQGVGLSLFSVLIEFFFEKLVHSSIQCEGQRTGLANPALAI